MHGLDALRAGALLLGVVLHSLMPFVPGMRWLITDQVPRSYAMPVIATIHLFRMTVFLVLAGFFGHLVVDKRGMGRFVRERAVRIALPVVVFWSLVVMPLGLIAFAWHTEHGMALPAAEGTFSLGHLWFLWVLFECVLILATVPAVALRLAPNVSRRTGDRLSGALAGPWALPILAIPYFAAQMWQGATYAGITEPSTFVPEPSGLLAYVTAFVAGWLIWRGAMAVLLVSYDLFVRSTWVGAWLNGRRRPRLLTRRSSA